LGLARDDADLERLDVRTLGLGCLQLADERLDVSADARSVGSMVLAFFAVPLRPMTIPASAASRYRSQSCPTVIAARS